MVVFYIGPVIQAINRCLTLVVNEIVGYFYGDLGQPFYGLFLFIALILWDCIILQVCFKFRLNGATLKGEHTLSFKSSPYENRKQL